MRTRLKLTTSLMLAMLMASITQAQTIVQDEPLGRLFFTPEKRAALDRQRQLNLVQTKEATNDAPNITVNGVVRRSSGKRTTWINGTPIDENLALPGTPITSTPNAPARVGVGEHQLNVGESVNQGTGEKEDLLRGGRIIVAPKSTPKIK